MPLNPPTAMATGRHSRLLLLDFLRLAAALCVMAYHYIGAFGPLWWDSPVQDVFPRLSSIAAYGAMGVQLFFIISGFVILMSAQNRSVEQFAASRISRLFPAYWTSVLLAAVLLLVLTDGELNKVTWSDVLINMTMLQQSVGVKSLDGVFWTLWIELLFYITIALFLWRGITHRRVLAFIVVWPLVGLMSLQVDPSVLRVVLIPEYAPLFAIGMGLYLVHEYGHSLIRWLAVGSNVVLAGHQTVALYVPMMEQSTGRHLSTDVAWLLVLGFVGIVAAVTTTRLRNKGWGWMTTAGALTYPFYLVHEMWGWWIIKSTHRGLGTWPAVFVALSSTLMLAWLINRFIERPFGPKLKVVLLAGLSPMSRNGRSVGVDQTSIDDRDTTPVMASTQ